MDKEAGPDWAVYRRGLGDRLRETRLRRNLTQEALADQAEVGRSTLQTIELGGSEAPRLAALWRIARVLDVPVHDLLRDDRPTG